MRTRLRWGAATAAVAAVAAVAASVWFDPPPESPSAQAEAPPPPPRPVEAVPLPAPAPTARDATSATARPRANVATAETRSAVIALAARAAAEGEHGTASENATRIAEEFRALGPTAIDFLAGWLFTDGRTGSGMDGAWLLSTIATPAHGDEIARLLHEGSSAGRSLALRWLSRPRQQRWPSGSAAADIAAGLGASVSDRDQETALLAVFELRRANPRHCAGFVPRLFGLVVDGNGAMHRQAVITLRAIASGSPGAAVEALDGLERCPPERVYDWGRVVACMLPAIRGEPERTAPYIDRIMGGRDRDRQMALLLACNGQGATPAAVRYHAERIVRDGPHWRDDAFVAIARGALEE